MMPAICSERADDVGENRQKS